MTIDEAYVWYRDTPNALSELLEMNCEHEMIVKENKKLRVDLESERDYANQMEAIKERLQAENEKLESRLTIYMADAETWNAQWVAEHESNAKLRELVRDALTTISWCTIDCYPSDSKKRELNERAKELGIEVES